MNDHAMTRRAWLTAFARTLGTGAALSALLPVTSRADVSNAPPKITVYKDPSCGCCTKWVEHLRSAGLHPDVHDRTDMDALKNSLGVPTALRSCHTAVAGRYAHAMVDGRFFSHVSPGGSTMLQRIRSTHYLHGARGWALGENLAWGAGRAATPGQIVRARNRQSLRDIRGKVLNEQTIQVSL